MLNNVLEKPIRFLSRRRTVIFLFPIALFFRIEFALFNQEFNTDKEIQIIAAQSFINGNGFRLPVADTSDISRIHYKDYYQWPKGYSVYFCCVYYLVRDVFWASFVLDMLAILLYVVSWWQLIKIFSREGPQRNLILNLFLLLTAFSNVPFICMKSSDLVALGLYMFSMAYLFRKIDRPEGRIFFLIGLTGLCLTVFERYAYIPVTFSLLIGVLLLYIKTRKKFLITRFIFAALVLFIFVVLINHSGDAPAFENEAGKNGFQWKTLSDFNFMFPLQSILASNTIYSLSKILSVKYLTISKLVLLAPALFITIWIIKDLVSKYFSDAGTLPGVVMTISALIAGIISVLLLVYMSLTRPVQNNDILINWTYVQEERYYVIIWMALLMCFLFSILHGNRTLRKYALSFLFISILIEIPYFFYNKYLTIQKNNTYFLTGEDKIYFPQFITNVEERDRTIKDYDRLGMMINAAKMENGIRPIYLAQDRGELIGVLKGAIFCSHDILCRNIFSQSRQKIILVLPGNSKSLDKNLESFVERHMAKYVYQGQLGSFYSLTVSKNLVGE